MRRARLVWSLVIVVVAAMAVSSWAAEESALAKIKNSGTLKVCVAQQLPEMYKNPTTGEFNGVFVDLLNELTHWMNVKLELVEVTWDMAVLSLNRGDCDLFGASLIYNAPRAMQLNYIKPFGAKSVNVIIKKGNPKKFRVPEDLNTEKVTLAVNVGSREHETAKRLFPNAKILALKVTQDVQLTESVKRGDADAALFAPIVIRWWLMVPENRAWAVMGLPGNDFGNAPNGWAIRYGDPDWKSFLDAFVDWVIANKMAVNLYEEYMKKTGPFAVK